MKNWGVAAFAQILLESLDRQRAAEKIALIGGTATVCQKVSLLFRLNSFGDNAKSETVPQCEDRTCDSCIIVIRQNIADEALVNFQLIKRQALQIRKR